ncbi:MAG: zinc-ribbon domain-containing protein [Chloroflexi bacterium]|nr:zinc-ribbon domain-containing protein [Chloroflexota bacterium]MCL5075561.1 zinc-ribbon domain-containing protein [Chloroflexota bacterium]
MEVSESETKEKAGVSCPKCGATNQPGNKFCGQCGAEL